MFFGNSQPESGDTKWRRQLDKFVKANQQELAALFWGLWLANGDSQGTVGIDLQPTPHFVYCPKEQIDKLNNQVDNRLQEILGIVENHQPEIEVVMIGIGKGEIKLIQFAPEPAPPTCFEEVGKDVDGLLDVLEERMRGEIVF
ncbi:beta-carboxysome assembly chaperone CcmS [Nostoc sp.]|uniref:beta-carboxysome assembly chaperone CcmS n=1 Tax=Nostoc sp. TaxID=1180 RepID=UPI002FF7A42C